MTLTYNRILNILFKSFNVLITLILAVFIIGAFYKPVMQIFFSFLTYIFNVDLAINLLTI